MEKQAWSEQGPTTRAISTGRLIEHGISCLSQKSCINDAVRLWNKLPMTVTNCVSTNEGEIPQGFDILDCQFSNTKQDC